MHVAIIMDGNRRWAKRHHIKPWEGHKAGSQALKKMLRYWLGLDVKYLTLYTLSLDNFTRRNAIERKYLYEVFKIGFKDLRQEPAVRDQKIKINVIGRWDMLPDKKLKSILQDLIDHTKNAKEKVLTFCICYDGRDELVDACKTLVKSGQKVSEASIKANMFSRTLPPVDLLIRTGGEKRLSGFMLWDSSYAELYFTEILFPDAIPRVFDVALAEFKKRKRRFGK